MNNPSHDAGIIQTLLDRLNNQRLPRALELKALVDAGGTLGEYDLQFLDEVLADAHHVRPLVEHHPECQEIAARMIHLYKEIMDKALENENKR